MALLRCSKCMLPETYETIEFDEKGICNICRSSEYKKSGIDWGKRKLLLDEIVEKHRGKYDYDCIVPFSGGKDSTFQLLYLIKEYKLKVLVVRFNHGFMRSTIKDNVESTLKQLGADIIEFTPNWKVVKRVMKEAFIRKTDFCWHCHTGIYSYPIRVAINFNIPLIFYGEPLAEFSAYYDYLNDEIDYEDEKKFNLVRNLGISADDMYEMINSEEDPVDKRDLLPLTYPDRKDIRESKIIPLTLGSFIEWDPIKQTKLIKKELGWKCDDLEGVPSGCNSSCEKIECYMQGPRDYIKYTKRGYSRVSQITSFDIRNGQMDRKEAEKIVALEGRRPKSIQLLLEYMDMDNEEFESILKQHAIPPYTHDFSAEKIAEKTWDFDQWYREKK
jgi:N-acetyl sugar amidotransferase